MNIRRHVLLKVTVYSLLIIYDFHIFTDYKYVLHYNDMKLIKITQFLEELFYMLMKRCWGRYLKSNSVAPFLASVFSNNEGDPAVFGVWCAT